MKTMNDMYYISKEMATALFIVNAQFEATQKGITDEEYLEELGLTSWHELGEQMLQILHKVGEVNPKDLTN